MGTELKPEISHALKRLPDWSGFIGAVAHTQLQGQPWVTFLVEHLTLQRALHLSCCGALFFTEAIDKLILGIADKGLEIDFETNTKDRKSREIRLS